MSGHVIRLIDDPGQIDGKAWNRLLDLQQQPTPFMRHEFLLALHDSACAVAATGWTPRFVCVHRGDDLVAACPAYLKGHSYGEYVFDWAWADAYQQHGLAYYPKLLVAVPFTPVTGTRLMADGPQSRAALLAGLSQCQQMHGASSIHLLFQPEGETAGPVAAGYMPRRSVQFHWEQQAQAPWPDFEAFLASLQRDKRKKIQQERRKVVEAGVVFTAHEGPHITDQLWQFFHHCYTLTYRAHRSKPYLSLAFFQQLAQTMPEHWLMFVGWRDGAPVAASLVAIDRQRGQAWGRYWGCTEYIPCAHFEACYYQPLAWCMAQGLQRFEGGAQGEHKMARGLLPTVTHSTHWLAHPEFARAVEHFLHREGAGVAAYVNELQDHSPYKTTD